MGIASLILCRFSLSKWVHLNGGDAGIRRLFQRVYSVLKPGGTFVLESQPWDTYAKARRQHNLLWQTVKPLQLRPDDFPGMLQSIGFQCPQRLGVVGNGGELISSAHRCLLTCAGFCRPVDMYEKL